MENQMKIHLLNGYIVIKIIPQHQRHQRQRHRQRQVDYFNDISNILLYMKDYVMFIFSINVDGKEW